MHVKASVWRILIILFFLSVITWLLSEEDNLKNEEPEVAPAFKVSAIKVQPDTVKIHVTATGIAMTRWLADVTASVSGRLSQLSEQAEPGSLVEEGFVLAKLRDTSYVAEVKAEQARLKRAELNLAQYLHEQYVATSVNKGKKTSAFGRFEPHVAAAKAEVASMQASINAAKQRLIDTSIKTPFSGIIINKYVTPLQWINTGDRLFSIASDQFIDINVSLSKKQWQQLGNIKQQANIQVLTPEGELWQASVRFLDPKMNETTRQRSIVLQVKNPYSRKIPLLSGQQVDITFDSTIEENIVRAPASVLTQDGKVWSIIAGKFSLENIQVIDESNDQVLFRYLSQPTKARVLVEYPLGTMLEGQHAIAMFDEL